MIGFISTSVTRSLNYTYYNTVADLHIFPFNVAYALGFSVFTSRLLAKYFNTETFSVILGPLIVLRHGPPQKTRVACWIEIYWSVNSTERGANDIENTSPSTVA
jgi:hypothetical protein